MRKLFAKTTPSSHPRSLVGRLLCALEQHALSCHYAFVYTMSEPLNITVDVVSDTI